jgi:hypothetical protein
MISSALIVFWPGWLTDEHGFLAMFIHELFKRPRLLWLLRLDHTRATH